ncbi:MAG: V-type ATPase 116kDa subunit family protein [Caldisericia bacterium]|nr:V-type ATPase 116kDa subunit family protein [Caldisericia bacterium]MDD4614820.1 V-type ATPase 116kDa subunit family protein [Caldisericia bacterium]
MAIEKFHLLRFVVPKNEVNFFRNTLYEKGFLHLRNVSSLSKPVLPTPDEISWLEEDIRKASEVLSIFEAFHPDKKTFVENFIPKKPIFSQKEIQKVREKQVFQETYSEVVSLWNHLKKAKDDLVKMKQLHSQLLPFSSFSFSFSDCKEYHRTKVVFLQAEGRKLEDLEQFEFLRTHAVIVPVRTLHQKKEVLHGFIVIYPTSLQEKIRVYLHRAGFKEYPFHSFVHSPNQELDTLQQRIYQLTEDIQKWEDILEEYRKQLPHMLLWKDVSINKAIRAEGMKKFAQTNNVAYIEGYIPSDQSNVLVQSLEEEFPTIYIDIVNEPTNPPVKLKNHRFIQPFEFLVRMYGLPRFGLIDPTALVGIVFIVLFGVAFADGLYGLSMMLLCAYSMKKYWYDKGTVSFFQMFFWAGFFAFLFGAFTESWAGDLFTISYLPANSFFVNLKSFVGVMNPSESFIALMVGVIYIGAFLQCTAILMSFLQRWKEKQYAEAFFNNLSWILFIPSAVIVAGQFLSPGYYPVPLVQYSQWLCLLSLLMIFAGGMIQSRNNIFKGIIKGFLNMYGIQSSYGVATLLGDVLSYLRLAALMIATSSMAMSFNLIASMFKSIPYVGVFIMIFMILFLNVFNFLLNIIGSFVHPVRLLFYEMFGRFYEDGGVEYHSYSQKFSNVFVVKEAKR